MEDQKNHSFTSSSKIRRFFFQAVLFLVPVALGYWYIEHTLAGMNFPEAVKRDYLQEASGEIEILFLGSSQVDRAVNPRHFSRPTINLANKSQLIFEDFELLKHFKSQLPNLQLVVLELSYDKLERDKTLISPALDPKNLKFYGVNTFGRPLKIQDHFLFHSNPDHFSLLLKDHFFSSSSVQLNKYGFDENKYTGAFKYSKGIFIENVRNEESYQENLQILNELIRYCLKEGLDVLIYTPPTYSEYNELRDPELVEKWQQLLENLKEKYPDVKFYIDDTNPSYEKHHFYDGNHLNPDGAKKASKALDSFITEEIYNSSEQNLG